METTIEKIPTYALCYFVYGDSEGLNDEDKTNIAEWLEKSGVKEVIGPDNEEYDPYFTSYPAFGLPTEVVDCVCILTYN